MNTATSPSLHPFADRAFGALVGLAVGDALGTTLEFSPRDSAPRHTEMTGGGPFRLPPGVWTDDTSMALCLADTLVSRGQVDPGDLMGRFARWWRDGENSPTGACFDIGLATRAALDRFERTGDPLAGDPAASAAGNGSLMRLAPAALFHCDDRSAAGAAARLQSQTTHATPECLDACDAFARLLVDAIGGEARKQDLLSGRRDGFTGQVGDILAGGWRGKPREAIRSSGYVIHTLEAALWCVDQASSFEEALILAVNLADDADTVGAVTGQLAGAVWGLSGIPDRWLAPLAWRTRLLDTAQALLVGGAARRGLPAFLRPNIGHSPEDAWIDKVLEGRWAAIPADLDYDESCELAHLLQGYSMAGRLGLPSAGHVAGQARAGFIETGQWTGSASELWITLFFEHRRDRHVGTPSPKPHPDLDALCAALRGQLLAGAIWPPAGARRR